MRQIITIRDVYQQRRRPLAGVLSVRLHEPTLRAVVEIAHARGVRPSALVRDWVEQRVSDEGVADRE
jgi:hypothetical protein